MTDNTTLDAAIKAALIAHKMAPEACNEQMRVFVRNIIAKLLEGMEMAELSHWHAGYSAALTEIRRRAGLEVES
jgi:hypothetical protein